MDKNAVDRWRRGQAAASKRIEEERTRRAAAMTPAQSLRIYLSLQSVPRRKSSLREPSPVLIAMRRLLDGRANKAKARR